MEVNLDKLYKDLYIRIPYDPMIKVGGNPNPFKLSNRIKWMLSYGDCKSIEDAFYNCIPYLRSLSTITNKERSELLKLCNIDGIIEENGTISISNINNAISIKHMRKCLGYLNSHHFDLCDLIPIGLAIEAPKDMYKFE